MQSLPYEVWEHVTTFLPSKAVEDLLAVNSSLFDIAMNERYRISTFADINNSDSIKCLRRLGDPSVAARVRTFIFKPGGMSRLNLFKEGEENPIAADRVSQSTLSHSDPQSSLPSVTADELVSSLPWIMSRMYSLRNLQVEVSPDAYNWFLQDPQSFCTMFYLGWSSFRDTLNTLDLTVPLDVIPGLLPIESVPNLKSFCLSVSQNPQDDAKAIVIETLLPFLHANRLSLRSLTLNSVHHTNLSLLLSAVSLPNLTHFNLTEGSLGVIGVEGYAGLKHFFESHSGHLTHFEFAFRVAPLHSGAGALSFFKQEFFFVSLPKLQQLYLRVQYAPYWMDVKPAQNRVVNYASQFKSSLLSLEISSDPVYISMDGLKELAESFGPSVLLKTLIIDIGLFSPSMVNFMATGFPNLETLTLDFSDISPKGSEFDPTYERTIAEFATELRRMKIPRCRLRTLGFSGRHASPKDNLGIETRIALLEALPSLQSLCGKSRESHIREWRDMHNWRRPFTSGA